MIEVLFFECIYVFNILGGYYSDTEAFVSDSCLRCPDGTFVSENDAPGRSAKDCRACPQGSDIILLTFHLCLKASA